MLFLTLWFLVLILERSISSNQRSVNLALETVLQFDKSDDFNVINKMQNFLSNIQVLLNKTFQVNDDVNTRRINQYKFTDFVEDLITKVKSFEDNDLKHFFRIVDKEFRTRRINDDLIDDNVRRSLSRKLTEIKIQPALNIRKDLDKILTEIQGHDNEKNSFFLDFINSLYKRDSEKKFFKLIKRLNIFLRSTRKSKVILKYIIEKIVNDVIFEHYNNLEDNEKDDIKKIVMAYFVDDKSIAKNFNIKQRAEENKIIKESINTNEIIDESGPTKQVIAFHLIPQTFKDIPKETTKKILTHITLYPKTIKLKKIPSASPTLEMVESIPTSEENTEDKTNEDEIKETDKIFKNQSVEISVSLFLDHDRDSLDRDDTKMIESFKSFKVKSTPKKVFPRALMRKSVTKYRKSSPAASLETFGNLYRGKKPKRYNYKKKSRLQTYDRKTTTDDRYSKSRIVNNIVKEAKALDKQHIDTDTRRLNKPTNLNEKKVPESDVKAIGATTKLRLFTKRASVSRTISTDKVPAHVTTDKSTTKTTQYVALNKILKNITNFKEMTKKPLIERISTNIDFVSENTNTPFKKDSSNNFNNTTTVNEVTVSFNVNNYIKNSEVLNFEDEEKKKQIEEKIRADFGNFLATPATNATQDFTDIFKELEDAFEL